MSVDGVTVIIVNWNGAATLPRCLAALAAQTYSDFETIVVDNGSTDGSCSDLEQKWPTLNLFVERLSTNVGFAAGNNRGAVLAHGRWLALINADAFPRPDWLESLMRAAKDHPEFASFASCLVQADAPARLDGTGDVYHVSGLAWRRHHGRPVSAIQNESGDVFSACAAAALYRRDAFLELGGFDETFFCYHEDVDLGFRMRLKGYRCLYVPEAVVSHLGSASSRGNSDRRIYWGHRNLVWTYVRNMPWSLFWLCLPAHLVMTIAYVIVFTLFGHGRAIWQAKVDALRGFGDALNARRKIQRGRQVGAVDVLNAMDWNWNSVVQKIIDQATDERSMGSPLV